jgi:hypothetical protein
LTQLFPSHHHFPPPTFHLPPSTPHFQTLNSHLSSSNFSIYASITALLIWSETSFQRLLKNFSSSRSLRTAPTCITIHPEVRVSFCNCADQAQCRKEPNFWIAPGANSHLRLPQIHSQYPLHLTPHRPLLLYPTSLWTRH